MGLWRSTMQGGERKQRLALWVSSSSAMVQTESQSATEGLSKLQPERLSGSRERDKRRELK